MSEGPQPVSSCAVAEGGLSEIRAEVMGPDVDGWPEVASRCLEFVCVVCSCGLGSAGAVFYVHLVFSVKQNCM